MFSFSKTQLRLWVGLCAWVLGAWVVGLVVFESPLALASTCKDLVLQGTPSPELSAFEFMTDEAVAWAKAKEAQFRGHIEAQQNWERIRADLSVEEERRTYRSEREAFPFEMQALWSDKTKFIEWAIELRNEVLLAMVQDGKANLKEVSSTANWAKYLDDVLLARAIFKGFKHQRFSYFRFLSYMSEKKFARYQAQRKIFDDWYGSIFLAARRVKMGPYYPIVQLLPHHRRGHAFQLDYASQYFPRFLTFYTRMGQNQNRDNLWLTYFDGTHSDGGLMWPGRVVEHMQKLMPITE